ncbi:restriction endonuclease [Streptomyces genisteinicus]|uniref:Restriction endonuclease n=1 Tax=Streptomyces genisteinicus TaxID=2768068 RepID=A0A7H0HR79_9ACTN|nr:restriction endonuclease [Streptomyces genisteinicus]QNP63045.1 restriction endonuclease [Streptomyces genisteinicus]
MTVPIRRPQPVTRRGAFSLRQTVLFFGLIATALGGAALVLKVTAGALAENPGAAAAGAGGLAAAALWLRKARRRRAAARLAGALVETAHRVAEAPVHDASRQPPPVRPAEEYGPGPEPFEAAEPGGPEPFGIGDVSGPEPFEAACAEGPEPFEAGDYAAMDAYAFEEAVAALCERDGCTGVEVVGGANDLGADVLATAPDGRRVVVQCKRYGPVNKVGSQEMQRFGGTCFAVHGAEVAVVVTTGEFTGPAADYAAQCGIRCVDHARLVAWTEGSGPAPWDDGWTEGSGLVLADEGEDEGVLRP